MGRFLPVTIALVVQMIMAWLLQGEMNFVEMVIKASIFQIFWNLTRNALRAMDTAGDLYVHGRLRQSVYCIGFRDTGRGMTQHEKNQLFYPFHTSFRGGTGIGMAIVYRIIEEHGGRLTVDTEAGRGTLIEVELPVGESAAAAAS